VTEVNQLVGIVLSLVHMYLGTSVPLVCFFFLILFLFIYFLKFFRLFGNLTWPVDCLNDAHGSHFGDLCFMV